MTDWIPIKEKLPDNNSWILFTVYEHAWHSDEYNEDIPESNITTYGEFNDFGSINPDQLRFRKRSWSCIIPWEYDEDGVLCNACVGDILEWNGKIDESYATAWMPLPEPYRGRKKGDWTLTRWRIPEENTYCLLTVSDSISHTQTTQFGYFKQSDGTQLWSKSHSREWSFADEWGEHLIYDELSFDRTERITAWMPLPEPYPRNLT